MIKLIATDLDGTFLRPPKEDQPGVDFYNKEFFRQMLDEMKEKNVKFVAASGRQIEIIERLFSEELADGYQIDFVGSNGAKVMTQGKILHDVFLSLEQIAQIIDWNKNNPKSAENLIVLIGEKYTYVSNHATEKTISEISKFYSNVKQVEKLMEVDDHIKSVTLVWPTEDVLEYVQALQKHFGNYIHATGSGFGSVDLLPKNVNKATALQTLQDHYGIKDDEVMVFGDNANDLEMLTKYEMAFLMPNAEDFMFGQHIGYIADAPNSEDGVLKTIKRVLDQQ